jgi:glutaredoxin
MVHTVDIYLCWKKVVMEKDEDETCRRRSVLTTFIFPVLIFTIVQVVIFTRGSCDRCRISKEAFESSSEFSSSKVNVQFFDLDGIDEENASRIQREIFLLSGQRQLPLILVNKNYGQQKQQQQQQESIHSSRRNNKRWKFGIDSLRCLAR